MKTGITFSSFDLLHAGHVAMLKESRDNCDYLIVGLQTDPTIDRPEKNKPIQTLVERYVQLKAVSYVDEIIPYESESDLINVLLLLRPDIRFIGSEYKSKSFTGMHITKIFYNSRYHNFSSTELRKRIEENGINET
jgi:glycerol-3-phosphate cytidylyltransferase